MTQESSIAQDIKILLVVGLIFKLNMDSCWGNRGLESLPKWRNHIKSLAI